MPAVITCSHYSSPSSRAWSFAACVRVCVCVCVCLATVCSTAASLSPTHSLNVTSQRHGDDEPVARDTTGQSDLQPAQAAAYWQQVDAFASSFSPPLKLVGPGMTHWDDTGGTPWLDEFLGNLSAAERGRIAFLAQHDYSGSPASIVAKAEAAFQRYGLRVWLTEFSVGSDADRAANDAFARAALPLLDKCDAIARYAWFSARNEPSTWVNESSLLPYYAEAAGRWDRQPGKACDKMKWLGQHGSLAECQGLALADAGCAQPKTVIYQSGDVQNCECSSEPVCNVTSSSWQDLYVLRGELKPWAAMPNTACAGDEMVLLAQPKTLYECQALAVANQSCFSSAEATKTVLYGASESSRPMNVYGAMRGEKACRPPVLCVASSGGRVSVCPFV
jgi:hypothetical protein